MRKVLVTGAGGFIGHHLVRRLKDDGHWVRGVDLKHPEYEPTHADEFVVADLRVQEEADRVLEVEGGFDDVYALAADMGGMGFISANHSRILHNNLLINLHTCDAAARTGVERYLYTSSACVYPIGLQSEANIAPLTEDQVYPAEPEDAYGWEKLITERLVGYYLEDEKLGSVRSVRFHNVYGPLGTWDGGREKAPAALCRKAAIAKHTGGPIEIWGDGEQTRSFMFIDDCLEGLQRIMDEEALNNVPINLGRDRMVSINQLAHIVADIAGIEDVELKHVDGPMGVRGRNSDNSLLTNKVGWAPSIPLEDGLQPTYDWIEAQAKEAGLLG